MADIAETGLGTRVPPPRTDVRVSDADPFSIDFFEDPHAIHDELREAAPVVWLSRWGCYAVARYEEVHAVLHDPETFCSSRGVGLSDFAKETPWRLWSSTSSAACSTSAP